MKTGLAIGSVVALSIGVAGYYILPMVLPRDRIVYADLLQAAATEADPIIEEPVPPPISHIATPTPVKAIYMTACIAATPRLRDKVVATLEDTEINALMIDIKDYSGTLAYASTSVVGPKGRGCVINDLPEFLAKLHAEGIYAIARVTVFQDPLYANTHPDIAVQSKSQPGKPWRDKKGIAFMDPNFPAYWDYIVAIAKEAHEIGFDEVNFDYIRFPSDGDMRDAMFAIPPGLSKVDVLTQFFSYLQEEMTSAGIVTSADIFGQTTVNYDDLGIGQVLEDVLPYFDYVAPMVYPSHFIKDFAGYANPANHPYEILKYTMTRAVERSIVATSSIDKLRPWLQDFDLGAVYTPPMVHAQMSGVYDSGLTSWMLWNPSNVYKKEVLNGVPDASAN